MDDRRPPATSAHERANAPLRSRAWAILAETFRRWLDDGAMQWGAALAFYTVLSLAPLLMVVATVLALVARNEVGDADLVRQLQILLGEHPGRMAFDLLQNTPLPDTLTLRAALSAVLLILSSTILFVNVREALNRAWGVRSRGGAIRSLLRARLVAFLMILASAVIISASVLLTAALAAVEPYLATRIPLSVAMLATAEFFLSAVVLTLLFAACFRILPAVRLEWRNVWLGAAVTAVLFQLGEFALGTYLSRAGLANPFGAAGSLVLFLLWVYYSAQIFFLGAEFTQVWTLHQGGRFEPEPGAVFVEDRVVHPSEGGPGPHPGEVSPPEDGRAPGRMPEGEGTSGRGSR